MTPEEASAEAERVREAIAQLKRDVEAMPCQRWDPTPGMPGHGGKGPGCLTHHEPWPCSKYQGEGVDGAAKNP